LLFGLRRDELLLALDPWTAGCTLGATQGLAHELVSTKDLYPIQDSNLTLPLFVGLYSHHTHGNLPTRN